jgi:hypothetical protein
VCGLVLARQQLLVLQQLVASRRGGGVRARERLRMALHTFAGFLVVSADAPQ